MPWLLIASGGAIWAVSRFAIDKTIEFFIKESTLGTFTVNITGSFLLGLFIALANTRYDWPIELRLFVAIGFLGSYTTFSTLTVASIQLAIDGHWGRFMMNVLGSMIVGLLSAALGIFIGKAL